MLSRLIIAFLPSSNFMAAVTICSDFRAPKNSLSLFPLFPHLFATMDWLKIGKEVHQGCTLSPCLFNFCQEKYQQPQICRWHHRYGRKWRRTKEPLNESERREWKSWFKASTLGPPMNTQDWSPQNGLVGPPCSPRDSQESFPTPQFKSINSSSLSFLYSPTLTSIHNHWKNHSLD